MEKIFNNEGEMKRRLERAKTSRVYYDLPAIDFDENGAFYEYESVRIQTLAEFEEYCKKHQVVAEFLMENYPKFVADIYRNAMTELSDYTQKTNASRILSGKPVSSNVIYQTAFSPAANVILRSFINTFNYKQADLQGKTVELPKFKKTKKQILKMLQRGDEGYFIPEIDANGLVVSKDGGKYSTNFIAVSCEDVTREQVLEYLKAPFGDRADELGIDFEAILEKSKKTFNRLYTADLGEETSMLVDRCGDVYPLSFKFKPGESKPLADTNPTVVAPEIEDFEEIPFEEVPVAEEIPEETFDELEVAGGSVVKPKISEDGELVVGITPERSESAGVTYKFVLKDVPNSRLKIDGKSASHSRLKRVEIVAVESERD